MNALLFTLALFATANADLQQRAESAFRMGIENRNDAKTARAMFQQAAEAYAAMRTQGADNAELHQNEGNARVLAGDAAGAILAYHRGLRHDPNSGELRRGLHYARSRVAFATADEQRALGVADSRTWGSRLIHGYRFHILAVLTSLGSLACIAWFLSRRHRWLAAGIGLFTAAGIWTAASVWTTQDRGLPHAVVVRSSFLRKGNGVSFPLQRDLPLPAGTEAKVRFDRGSWKQVELADGSVGWLPANAVEIP